MTPTITRWRNLRDPEGTSAPVAWSDLFTEFSKPRPAYAGDDHPGWSPVEFSPCRRARENARRVFAVCLDYDAGESLDAATGLWGAAFGLLHTTRKHLPDAPRFRVILPWARPVSPFEHEALWLRIAHHAGGKLDPAPKDPSRFWFTPGARDPEFFQAIPLTGDPLDPDEWLAKPAPAPPRDFGINTATTYDPPSAERRASAYVARMPEAISGQGGHGATWSVALTLVKGFGLSESAALRILESEYNPRCVPPWSRRELEHKIRQASAARVPDGFKLDDGREWKPRRELPPCPPDDPTYVPEPPPEWADDYFADSAPRAAAAPEARQPGDDSEQIAVEQAQPDTRSALERYGFLSMVDLMQGVVTELRKPKPRMGAPTGHHELDNAIGGFRPGNVTVFGAKRGVGKSTYSNLVTGLALDAGLTVLMFAGEDSELMYGKRFLATRAGLNAMRLRDNKCDAADWPRITDAVTSAPKDLFFVRTNGRPVEWMAQVIRDVAKEKQIDIVIADYLQCLKTAKRLQDRRNEVTYVTKTLGDAVKGVNAAGLFLSQLKRTERVEPEVEDLKESGDIEDMAEHIMLGWKEDGGGAGTNVTRKIKLGKNKDGIEASDVAPVVMPFDPKTAAFSVVTDPNDKWAGDFDDRRY